ncbi:MAG: DUF1559 domain-containing protein [Thermoguttaceae bacterium]
MKRKIWYKLLLLFVIFLLGALAMFFSGLREVPLMISKKTTYVTEPRTSDGKHIDYFKALEELTYSPGIDTEDNGYRLVVQKLGVNFGEQPQEKDKEAYINQMYEKLGLDPNVDKPSIPFVTANEFLTANVPEGEDASEYRKRIWGKFLSNIYHEPNITEEGWQLITKYAEENGPGLDVFVEAAKKPVFCIPFTQNNNSEIATLLDLLLPDIMKLREVVRSLQTRAYLSLKNGDFDKAYEDVVTIARLGCQVDKGLLVAKLNGNASVAIAYEIPCFDAITPDKQETVEKNPKPTEEQLLTLLRELRNLPKRSSLEKNLVAERYLALSALQFTAVNKEDFHELFGIMPKKEGKMVDFRQYIDWNVTSARLNQMYDELEEGEFDIDKFSATLDTPIENAAGFFRLFLSRNYRSKKIGDIFSALFCPAIGPVCEAIISSDCMWNLKQVILAALMYEQRHGTLPPMFSTDTGGKPLHSWRVLILPFLDDPKLTELYEKIRLDEPWDSEYNRQFHDIDIPVFQCPSLLESKYKMQKLTRKLKPGETTYAMLIPRADTPHKTAEVKATAPFIIERETPSCWMNPNDGLVLDSTDPIFEGQISSTNKTIISQRHMSTGNYANQAGSIKNLLYEKL